MPIVGLSFAKGAVKPPSLPSLGNSGPSPSSPGRRPFTCGWRLSGNTRQRSGFGSKPEIQSHDDDRFHPQLDFASRKPAFGSNQTRNARFPRDPWAAFRADRLGRLGGCDHHGPRPAHSLLGWFLRAGCPRNPIEPLGVEASGTLGSPQRVLILLGRLPFSLGGGLFVKRPPRPHPTR